MEELGSSQSNGPGQSVGQTAWRPYAPTGVRIYDDDDDDDDDNCIPTAKCSLVLKLGQDLGNRAGHLYQEFRGVPPAPPPPPPGIERRTSVYPRLLLFITMLRHCL